MRKLEEDGALTPIELLDLQPTLSGPTLLLRPLREADFEPLLLVASDPLIWEQHPEPDRYRREVFQKFFAGALASRGALIVIDNSSGETIGSSRYYDLDPAERSVAIGYTFLARRFWGGATNGEMKRLMLEHAFSKVDTVWFHIGSRNIRSRRALEKIGGVLDREEPRELNGIIQDYAFYKIERGK